MYSTCPYNDQGIRFLSTETTQTSINLIQKYKNNLLWFTSHDI